VRLNPLAGDGTGLVNQIVAAQSLDVDGVTGATISTKTVLATVGNSLMHSTGQSGSGKHKG
jgi:uncharacterized protein with FMN-binding domain